MNANFVGFISFFSRFYRQICRGKGFYAALYLKFLMLKKKVLKIGLSLRLVLNPEADVSFENVNFHYPGRPDLLQTFSTSIFQVEKVTALVGESGLWEKHPHKDFGWTASLPVW